MYTVQTGPDQFADMDQNMVARARYLGYMRHTMPPRCSPVSILICVLALGMLFIGITMTLIANWPGATTIGENPLKIAGPVLLGVGGLTLFIGIFLACYMNVRDRRKWEQSITDLAAQRSSGVAAQPLVAGGATYPYSDQSSEGQRKSILRTSKGSGDADAGGYYDGKAYPVEGLPDVHDEDPADLVPDPVRVRKSKSSAGGDRSGIGSSSGSEIGAADLGGLGVYSPTTRGSRNLGYTQGDGYTNNGYSGGNGGRRGEDEWRQEGRRGRGGPSSPSPPHYDNIAGAGATQEHLHVHIRAPPGAAVHITPSATPSRLTPTRGSYPLRQHDDSTETEI